MGETATFATYIRRSTAEQEEAHQRQGIREWLADRELDLGDVDVYAEQASGASEDRDQFHELLDSIEAGEYTDVVVWEISRIARKGFLAQRFFDACEDNGVTIHVTNGSVRTVEPDGHGRMVADVIAAVAAEERRSLIRRTEAGVKRAKREGSGSGRSRPDSSASTATCGRTWRRTTTRTSWATSTSSRRWRTSRPARATEASRRRRRT